MSQVPISRITLALAAISPSVSTTARSSVDRM